MSDEALDALRTAFVELLITDRRVRGREGHQADGLSMAHYRMMSCLLDEERLPAGRLAAAAELSPASTTQMLDLLERRGMIERERDPADRRVVVASLTDEGRRQTTERRAAFRQLWEETLGDLSDAEMAAGTTVLRRIAEFMEALTARKAELEERHAAGQAGMTTSSSPAAAAG